MTKVTLNDIGSLIDATTAANQINVNNTTVETAFDNTLSRDGTSPNSMNSSLDMNSNQILNLPYPSTINSPVRFQDLTGVGSSVSVIGEPHSDVLTSISGHGTNTGYLAILGDGTVNTRTFTATTATGLTVANGNGHDGSTEYAISPTVLKPTLSLVKADVGLGNVDNTSDATKNSAVATLSNKTLVAPALGTPASGVLTNTTGLPILTGVSGLGTGVGTFLNAPTSAKLITALAGDSSGTGSATFNVSPTLLGVPLTTTAAVNTNNSQIASTAFVLAQGSVASPLIDGTAAAGTSGKYSREDHVHPTDTTRAALASPALTGTPTAPTASPGTNTTQLATTAYADAIAALKANIASPTFTGTPAAPTAAVDTNTTQLATTAMVLAQAASATPLVNGTAAVGTSTRYARGDHVHPIDTRMGLLASTVTSVNFNSAASDNAVAITLPTGFTRFSVLRIGISHASASLTTSTFSLWTAPGASGVAIVASGTANTVSATADNTVNNAQFVNASVSVANVAASLTTANTIYFRIQSAQGSAATGDVTVYYQPLP